MSILARWDRSRFSPKSRQYQIQFQPRKFSWDQWKETIYEEVIADEDALKAYAFDILSITIPDNQKEMFYSMIVLTHHPWELKLRSPTQHANKKKKTVEGANNNEGVFMAFVKHYFICNPQIKTADMKGFWLEKHPTIEYPSERVSSWITRAKQGLIKRFH